MAGTVRRAGDPCLPAERRRAKIDRWPARLILRTPARAGRSRLTAPAHAPGHARPESAPPRRAGGRWSLLSSGSARAMTPRLPRPTRRPSRREPAARCCARPRVTSEPRAFTRTPRRSRRAAVALSGRRRIARPRSGHGNSRARTKTPRAEAPGAPRALPGGGVEVPEGARLIGARHRRDGTGTRAKVVAYSGASGVEDAHRRYRRGAHGSQPFRQGDPEGQVPGAALLAARPVPGAEGGVAQKSTAVTLTHPVPPAGASKLNVTSGG
jgi:hypothetical protein